MPQPLSMGPPSTAASFIPDNSSCRCATSAIVTAYPPTSWVWERGPGALAQPRSLWECARPRPATVTPGGWPPVDLSGPPGGGPEPRANLPAWFPAGGTAVLPADNEWLAV